METTTVPTLFEWQARCTVGAAKNLAHWVKSTQADKLAWKAATGPESKTRCIVEQMEECIRVNRRFAKWLVDDQSPLADGAALEDAETIERELIASAEELAAVIRKLDYGILDREFETAWGKMTGRELMVIPLANMYYHGGQVNYVQTLYGDTDMHFVD